MVLKYDEAEFYWLLVPPRMTYERAAAGQRH
jgi:hypothetical protein